MEYGTIQIIATTAALKILHVQLLARKIYAIQQLINTVLMDFGMIQIIATIALFGIVIAQQPVQKGNAIQ
jgi:hypothetical protein